MPKRTCNCWLEDLEVTCIKDKGATSKHRLLHKYGGLFFTDDAKGKMQNTILETNMYHKLYRRGGGSDGIFSERRLNMTAPMMMY